MIKFIELKQTYENITRAITSGSEPASELRVILHFLRDLSSNDGEYLLNIKDDNDETEKIGFTKS
jgi:hypothetical protein